MASPTVIGTPVFAQNTATNPASWDITTYTAPSTGSNRVLCLIVTSATNNDFLTAASWDSGGTPQALTKINRTAAVQVAEFYLWCVPAPTSGNKTLTLTTNGANVSGIKALVFCLQDAVQNMATILDVTGSSNVASATTDSKSITTTVDGDIIISTCVVLGDKTGSIAPGGGQTDIISGGSYIGIANYTMDVSTIGQASSGAISTSYSWTTNAGEDFYAHALKYAAPAASANGNFLAFM